MLPPIRLKKGAEDAVKKGMPWVYAGDIIESSQMLAIAPGSLVSVENAKGQFVATGYFNARSQIACRVLTRKREAIDIAFFETRLQNALERREAVIGVPYYRLAHSEADGLPGLTIDRFGDTCVAQVGTAGMELLQPLWLAALQSVIGPESIVLRNDSATRRLEGLAQEVKIIRGEVPALVEVVENGCVYFADLIHGQKTGWFYDQRDNRKLIAGLSRDKSVIDIYSHSGGFGIVAAKEGAKEVTLVDSSVLALSLAAKAAERNKVAERSSFRQGDAFDVMRALQHEGARFDIVLADPPAFVKTKKDIATGLKGYEKVARMAAYLVKEGGLLFVASCSHHAGRSAFNKAVLDGVAKAGFNAQIVEQTGASADHPRHNALAQNEYLKGLLLKLTQGDAHAE